MSPPATETSLRARLRDATTDAHARVHAQVGEMRNADGYRAYLRGMHGFLAAVTPGLAQHADSLAWSPPPWRAELDADLRRIDAEPRVPEPVEVGDRNAALGLLYAVEGSALGARLLLRRATGLGFAPATGAAFLHRFSDMDNGRWPAFLALLATWEARIDAPAACRAAQTGFAVADRCFHRAQEAMA